MNGECVSYVFFHAISLLPHSENSEHSEMK